ncbi:MAG: hypothetical protein HY537_15350 [Deltaproteobacteria bacterium]|nr:hypothetical protein [Deltaproteobacteria bacterium]
MASAIRALNARALLRFDPRDVQVTLWSIQTGVPYVEMVERSRKIVDAIIPEHRQELEKSFLKSFIEKWNEISDKTAIPSFDEVTDSTLDALGDFGKSIRAIREFRKALKSGGNYDTLRTVISLPGTSKTPGTETTTLWSKLSENVYARFLTSGHYLDVGKLEVRVVTSGRLPQTQKSALATINITSLVADPGMAAIQPLSFSPLHASAAIPILAAADSPLVVAFLAALIAAEYTDWPAVEKAVEQWGASTQREIQRLIEKLRQKYAKEFGGKPGQVKVPPAVPAAFPDLTPARQKTPRPGGGLRTRWKDGEGNIYEWDYQHGRLEKYDRRGNHLGEYDPNTGQQTKPLDPTRSVEP